MGNAILMGQSGGGLKPDQVRMWKKYSTKLVPGLGDFEESVSIISKQVPLFIIVGNPNAAGRAYYIPDDAVITINQTTGKFETSLPYEASNVKTKRAFIADGYNGLPLQDTYYEVDDVEQWTQMPPPYFGTAAPVGAREYKIIRGEGFGKDIYVGVVYGKIGQYPTNGIKDGFWYELFEGEPFNTSDATAVSNDIVNGKTAYISGGKVTGTFIGTDSSDATARASDINEGKTAYVNNIKITGTRQPAVGDKIKAWNQYDETKTTFIKCVIGEEGAYPTDGIKDGFWYELTTDWLAGWNKYTALFVNSLVALGGNLQRVEPYDNVINTKVTKVNTWEATTDGKIRILSGETIDYAAIYGLFVWIRANSYPIVVDKIMSGVCNMIGNTTVLDYVEQVPKAYRGEFISTIYGIKGTYPDVGVQDGYWYEKMVDTVQPIVNLVNSISYTGTYADSTHFTPSGCRVGCNANGEVLVVIQGGTSTAYENIIFNLNSAPSGIALVTGSTNFDTANPSKNYYVGILTGVTKPIDIIVDFDSRNSTYDYVRANLTVTYA